jgi:hypothetical protein
MLVLAATLPFLGKAFHIDDVLYLAVAHQILRAPSDPYGATIRWRFDAESSLFDEDFNPPLFNYLMAGVIWLAGDSEHALHVLESCFVAGAALALILLSGRFTHQALGATSLVLLSPAMLPGQNVMLEGPVMAFWLWAVWTHLRACETGDCRWTGVTGLLTALGVLTKYTAGLVIPILVLWSIVRQRWKTLWFVAMPVLALALWGWHNRAIYGRSHLWSLQFAQGGLGSPLERIPGVFVGYGSVSLLSILLLMCLRAHAADLWVVTIAACTQACIWLCGLGLITADLPAGHAVHFVAFGVNGGLLWFGLAALMAMNSIPNARSTDVTDGRFYRLDSIVLVAWSLLVVLYNCISVPFLAIRHLLPGLPPLVWLAVRALERANLDRRKKRAAIGITVVLTAIFGFALAAADFEFAQQYRNLPYTVLTDLEHTEAPATVREGRRWHRGSHGLLYYSNRAGMRYFSSNRGDQLLPGDVLVLSELAGRGMVFKDHEEQRNGVLRTSRRITLNSWIPLRTAAQGVQYYGFQTGTVPSLPWRFSIGPLETIQLITIHERPEGPSEPEENRSAPAQCSAAALPLGLAIRGWRHSHNGSGTTPMGIQVGGNHEPQASRRNGN